MNESAGWILIDVSLESLGAAPGAGEVQQTLEGELRGQAGGDPWALVLRADLHPRLLTMDSDFDGALVRGEKVFKVSATYAVEEMSVKLAQPSGFLFAREGQWVAAAEWTPPGSLRLGSGLDLIDEYRLVVSPILAGGGKPYFPALDHAVPLRLLETRTFRNGSVYLLYQRASI